MNIKFIIGAIGIAIGIMFFLMFVVIAVFYPQVQWYNSAGVFLIGVLICVRSFQLLDTNNLLNKEK